MKYGKLIKTDIDRVIELDYNIFISKDGTTVTVQWIDPCVDCLLHENCSQKCKKKLHFKYFLQKGDKEFCFNSKTNKTMREYWLEGKIVPGVSLRLEGFID